MREWHASGKSSMRDAACGVVCERHASGESSMREWHASGKSSMRDAACSVVCEWHGAIV